MESLEMREGRFIRKGGENSKRQEKKERGKFKANLLFFSTSGLKSRASSSLYSLIAT